MNTERKVPLVAVHERWRRFVSEEFFPESFMEETDAPGALADRQVELKMTQPDFLCISDTELGDIAALLHDPPAARAYMRRLPRDTLARLFQRILGTFREFERLERSGVRFAVPPGPWPLTAYRILTLQFFRDSERDG